MWPDDVHLAFEPLATGADFELHWFLVDASLAAQLELEVLDRVRHVRGGAIDPGFGERAIQQQARRTDERLTFAVLPISGLLSDQDDARAGGAGAEHRLRGVLPQ